MWWHDLYFILVFLLCLHLMILKNVWFILLGFSCNGACLSWIEFIFYLSMWASILVYIFEVIMEDRMMMLHTFMLWYDTLYDDNACDNDVNSMKLMHSYIIWCTCIPYCDDALLCIMMYTWWWRWCINGANWDDDDVYLMMMMHKWCTLRWWECILNDEDAYPLTMMHTLWWWCIPMMMMHDDSCLMLSESITELLVQ